MSRTTYPTYNLLTDVDDTRFLPAATELSDRVSGSVDTMNHTLIPTRVSSRNSRHLARSFNANTCTHDDVEQSEPLLHRTGNSVHYESIYDSEEYNSQRNGIEVIRKRLKAHFMTPLQKFKYRGRKPWKLVVQMFKIIFVTAQVALFGQELFSVVTYMEDSQNTFRNLFIYNYNKDGNFIFTKEQFYTQVRHTVNQYYTLPDTAVGIFALPTEDGYIKRLTLCKYSYLQGFVDPGNQTYTFNRKTKWECQDLLPPIKSDHQNLTSFVLRNNLTQDFDSCISISLSAAWIRSLHLKDDPECYKFNVTITFDNSKHDGKIPVETQTDAKKCSKTNYKRDADDPVQQGGYIFFDILVIVVCLVSFSLCVRSLYKHIKLVKRTKRFFKQQLNDDLSYWDCLDLINLWFVLMVISDSLTVLGSFFKILIEWRVGELTTVLSMYDICSIFLGTGVLFTWIGILRYLGYMKKYNLLLVTLQASGPSVLRFCVCGGLLYFGFMFCGWIVLGPYHPKFRTLSTVSECLFSLINGDDMFMTYSEMQKNSFYIWVFSKIYLYIFISLFIYVVLSLFIGIISDTYERIKDWGHPPCTKIQRFVHGSNCQRCAMEYRDIEDDSTPTIITPSSNQEA